MTKLLPELASVLPADVQLDGELVTWDDTGLPDFHRLSARMLHGDTSIAVTYCPFDLLACEGLPADGAAVVAAADAARGAPA